MLKNILYFIIAVTLSACGREEGKNGSPSSNQNSSVSETLPQNSNNCTSTADYEFGIKNGLKMAPPCENLTAQAENYKLTLKTSTCEQWLQSQENSSKFKITLKNDSRSPIRLVGKLGFRSAKNELLAEWQFYQSNSLQPNAETIEEVNLSVACQDIKEITLSSVDADISKIDEKQITQSQLQALQKDFKIEFKADEWLKHSKPPADQLAQTNSAPSVNVELEINEKNCKKVNAYGSKDKMEIATEFQVPLSSVQFLGTKWGHPRPSNQLGGGITTCSLVFDTAAGPKTCILYKLYTDDGGKSAWGSAVFFGKTTC